MNRQMNVLRKGIAPLLSASLLLGGCAGFRSPLHATGAPAVVDPGREVRPDAPPEYDVLVAQQHEQLHRLPRAVEAYRRALAKDPDSAFLHRRLADLLVRQGRPSEALEHAQRAMVLDPEDRAIRIFLARLYALRRDTVAAEDILLTPTGEPLDEHAGYLLQQIYLSDQQNQKALEIARWLVATDPDSVSGYLALARVFESMGKPVRAERALRQALERDPGSLQVYSQLARTARERGDVEGQQKIYGEVLESHPHHRATLISLADIQLAQDDLQGALVTLTEVESHYPRDLRSVERLGFLHYEAGNLADAALRFERVLASRPRDSEVAFFLGIVRRHMGEDTAAREAFAVIPDGSDQFAEARTQLAVLYEETGEFQRALEEIELAVAANPSRSRKLYWAVLRAKVGDVDGAVAYLEDLLHQNPGDDELLYNLGIIYGESKRIERALHYMERAIEHNPKNAGALNYVGYTWAERGDNLDQAETYIVRALDLRPDDGFIIDSLGWVYYMRARPLIETGREEEAKAFADRALKELLRAEELTGGDPVVSEHLGDTYLLLDQKRRALEKYENALDLAPRFGEQPELLDKLEALRREFE